MLQLGKITIGVIIVCFVIGIGVGILMFAPFSPVAPFSPDYKIDQTGYPMPPTQKTDQPDHLVTAAGKQDYTLQVDGVERKFIAYRPTNLSDELKVPVVFMFHGSGGGGDLAYGETGWKAKADAEGLMVIFPTALKYYVGSVEQTSTNPTKKSRTTYQTKWNSYELPRVLDSQYPDQKLYDDVAFTRAMVEFVDEKYAVDTDRLYATGFSNGAGFTSRLALEMSDVFAAFAPTAAGALGRASSQIKTTLAADGIEVTPRPVIQIIGAVDPSLTNGAGVKAFPLDESAVSEGSPLKENYVNGFLDFEQLADEYTYSSTSDTVSFTYAQSLIADDNEYQLIIVDGLKHIYPNGKNFNFDVADIFWPFFEQYSL